MVDLPAAAQTRLVLGGSLPVFPLNTGVAGVGGTLGRNNETLYNRVVLPVSPLHTVQSSQLTDSDLTTFTSSVPSCCINTRHDPCLYMHALYHIVASRRSGTTASNVVSKQKIPGSIPSGEQKFISLYLIQFFIQFIKNITTSSATTNNSKVQSIHDNNTKTAKLCLQLLIISFRITVL